MLPVCIETKQSFFQKSGLLVARTVVDPNKDVMPLRLMNVSNEMRVVFKDSIAAEVENVSEVVENETEDENVSDKLPPYMKDMFERCTKGLSSLRKTQVRKFFCKYQHVFSSSKQDIGRTSLVQHRIRIKPGAAPIKQRPYRQPPMKREETRRQIEKMLEADIIEPSASPWSSPIVLCKKKDGSWRFSVDARRVNEVTIKDSYPLPRIDDTLHALQGKPGERWFTTMDLSSGYWQVPVHPDDRQYTAFVTYEGLFQFKVIPYGGTSAPATFERLMETVLAGLNHKICLVYLDDIICFSDSFEKHLEHLGTIFE